MAWQMLKIEVRARYLTLAPGDYMSNSFWWVIDDEAPGPESIEAIVALIDDFYNEDTDDGGTAISDFMGPELERLFTWTARYFSPELNVLGDVVATDTFGMNALGAANDALPLQDAVVISLTGTDAGLDLTPLRRRRGRLFIGPLTTATLSDTGGALVTSNFCAILADAAQRMGEATLGPIWGVYSRADRVANPTAEGCFKPIVKVSVDNRYDVQRSRATDVGKTRIERIFS